MQSCEAAHRQADDMRLVDFECVEHRTDVVTRPLLRVTLSVIGHVGWWITPRVVGDAAVPLAEIAHLRLIGTQVTGEFVHPNDRNSAAYLFIVELDSIVSCHVRHGALAFAVSEVKAARRDAGINRHDRSAVIAAMLGRQETDHGANLFRRAGAAERQRLNQLTPILGIAGSVRAFFFIRPTSRSVSTGPGLTE